MSSGECVHVDLLTMKDQHELVLSCDFFDPACLLSHVQVPLAQRDARPVHADRTGLHARVCCQQTVNIRRNHTIQKPNSPRQRLQQRPHDSCVLYLHPLESPLTLRGPAVIGNKCDLEQERQVSTMQGRDSAKQFGIPFLEVR
jgi:hypothetical protein